MDVLIVTREVDYCRRPHGLSSDNDAGGNAESFTLLVLPGTDIDREGSSGVIAT